MSAPAFADEFYYTSNGFGEAPDKANALLARASRIVRAECLNHGCNIGEWIADGRVDADMVADVVCDMVQQASAAVGVPFGVESFQQQAGPYGTQMTFSDTAKRLSFTSVHLRRLGVKTGRAWNVDLLGG